jgi:sugar transferase (PEP-CTERM system associated)
MRRVLSARHLTLLAVEEGIILVALLGAMALRFGPDLRNALGDVGQWARIATVISVTQLSFYYNDLYELEVLKSRREFFIRLLQAMGAASIALGALYYAAPKLIVGRGVFILFVGIAMVILVAWRLTYRAIVSTSVLSYRVLLVGAGDMARVIYKEARERASFGIRVVGCLAADPEDARARAEGLPPVLGGFEQLKDHGTRSDVDRIVVAIGERRGKFPVRELLELRLAGCQVEDGCKWYEQLTGKMLIEYLKPSDLIFAEGFSKRAITLALKRTVDFVASAVGLIASLPVWLCIPALIKWDSPGPVFFRQERVGEGGRPFQVLKFRSMRADAEKVSGPVWAQEKDDRVTRIGRFIRKARIDEIPQLINVLKGEMSFVGPRPERPFFVEQLTEKIPYYVLRHSVRPGVTGLAQVKYSYGSSVDDSIEKLRYDLYHIKRLSFWMDLSIIFETVKVVLFGKGAR